MTKTFALLVCLLAPLYAAPDSGANLAVDGGTASFLVTTNVPAISVKGKSTALQARVRMERNADGLHLAEIEASMPVSSIATGMSLRDEHMRRYIFTTGDSKLMTAAVPHRLEKITKPFARSPARWRFAESHGHSRCR